DFSEEIAVVITGSAISSELNFFPSPANNKINILGIGKILESKLTDLVGRVHELTVTSEGDRYVADIALLPPGVYILSVVDERTIHNFKFQKE
ncbi:MAG: T9SS type A sorting domain-containing protein, partial [Flammeovirgaceae bacterium]